MFHLGGVSGRGVDMWAALWDSVARATPRLPSVQPVMRTIRLVEFDNCDRPRGDGSKFCKLASRILGRMPL